MKKILFLSFVCFLGCSSNEKKENECQKVCLLEATKLSRVEKDHCVCSSKIEKLEPIKMIELKPIVEEK